MCFVSFTVMEKKKGRTRKRGGAERPRRSPPRVPGAQLSATEVAALLPPASRGCRGAGAD